MPRLPFQTIQQLDLPITEVVAGRIGCIHDAFLAFPYEVRQTLPKEERDLVVLAGKGKQHIRLRELAEHPGRVVVVFSPGDGSLEPGRRGRPVLPDNVVAVFSANNKMDDSRTVSVPLGVRTSHLPQLQFVRQNHRGGRNRLAYANFAVNSEHYRPDSAGRPHVRARIVDRFHNCPWLTLDVSDDHRNEPEQIVRYYSQIAAHRFVLSPQGNGIDCYRTWEVLSLGSIPVVMASRPMSHFADLPILFTEDYSELSEEYLEQRWEEMSSRSYEIERMLRSWYTSRFLEAVAKLERPRFVCWQVDGSPFDRAVRALSCSSRSISRLVVETPTPPFTGRRSFLEPDHWRAPGSLDLKRNGAGLEICARGPAQGRLELPLETIAGAPFRLTGKVRGGGGRPLALMVEARERSDVLASTEIAAGEVAQLDLEFVARSRRTILALSSSVEAAEGTALLSELQLTAEV